MKLKFNIESINVNFLIWLRIYSDLSILSKKLLKKKSQVMSRLVSILSAQVNDDHEDNSVCRCCQEEEQIEQELVQHCGNRFPVV